MQLTENIVVADRYRLSRMIGRGGMGSVWQAQHMGLDAPCAIKFIEGELANVAEAHARFEREAKAAAALRSPHVVQIFDHGVWQGMPYIAMELLDGQDLGKRLTSQGGRLSPSEVNTIVQQVCKALHKAHTAGVVHRDLKPDNIFLVNDDDGRPITKILDFGVAKSTSQAIDGSNTKTGAMLGTPYYMSPEQAQGIKSVDSRSDLWSLAVIVFQCLTGRLPFESEALGDLLVKIIVNPIPKPSDYYANVPAGFDAWWTKAADRNPDNRFQTAKQFAESLQMALGQSSITDVSIDRGKLQKLGGGTALMTSPSNAAMATPNPAHQSGAPMMQTPQPHLGPPIPNLQMSTGSPVAGTFSGVDQPVVPKKGPPVAVIAAAAGGLALVGAILIGVTLFGGKKGAAAPGATTDPAASASIAAPATASADPPIAKNAEPAATATATAEPTPEAPAASASAAASVAHAQTAPTAHATVKPSTGGTIAAKTSTTAAAPPAKPTATGATKPASGGKKPADLGF